MLTGPTLGLFVSILLGFSLLAWLGLNIGPRAAAVASELRARAGGRRAGSAAYIACWVLLFPVMLLVCIGGGVARWITDLEGGERADRRAHDT